MRRLSLAAVLFIVSIPTLAGDKLIVRVVDVGAGLCCVIEMPGGYYMVYDAGNYSDGGAAAFDAISDIIPDDEEIDLMVLSHSDADHLGAVDEICDAYTVKRVIRAGLQRSTGTWGDANTAILAEKRDEGCIDINLRYFEFPPGGTYRFGDTFVTMVFGLHKPPSSWKGLSSSEKRNAGSIVIRIVYEEKSILFCGDSVGRHSDGPPNQHIAAEKEMVANAPVITIDSDVIIAPHHGADNGSSKTFIEAVSPEYVIFSAGNRYSHPRKATADRYLALPVFDPAKMLRTDHRDKDEGAKEWSHSDTITGTDQDDIEITIEANATGPGTLTVKYR